MPQLVLQALWQLVWHSPQPPSRRLFSMSRVSMVWMCFKVGHLFFWFWLWFYCTRNRAHCQASSTRSVPGVWAWLWCSAVPLASSAAAAARKPAVISSPGASSGTPGG